MVEKLDFKKELAQLYAPKNKDWELIEVPIMNFLMVDGEGDPNTARDYSDAVEALYGLAYAIKFLSRKSLGRDYVVAPLEGLWTASDPTVFENAQKDQYQWTNDDHAARLDHGVHGFGDYCGDQGQEGLVRFVEGSV